MITSLRLVNFKNFADETLHLGPFTLIVGANASGKSNIRDAFRFLHGIGRYFTLAEIVGGKHGAEWQPIRGAPDEIIRFGENAFSLEVEMKTAGRSTADAYFGRYSIRIQRDTDTEGQFRVVAESLTSLQEAPESSTSRVLYTSDPPSGNVTGTQKLVSDLRFYLPEARRPVEVASDQPGLTQESIPVTELPFEKKPEDFEVEEAADLFIRLRTDNLKYRFSRRLMSMQFLELLPERLREPAFLGATRIGNFGDDMPAVLEAICADPKRKRVLLSWLHELTPMDVSDLKFPRDPSGRIHLQIQEVNGKEISAYSASDGTLRFLGMLAALLNEGDDDLYFFEEIDNGIHPARLHLLLDLIERQTAKGKIQVVATTHSPDVLNLINDTTFEDSVVVYRDEQSADAIIRRVAELPNARELRKSQGLGRLHTSGWMENILSFAEADKEDRQDGA